MKKVKKSKLLLFIIIFNSTTLHAFELISEHEHRQFLGNRSDRLKIKLRSFSSKKNLPEITVLQPVIDTTITSPTNIQLSFKATEGSKIVLDSLKFLYGWLGFDITNRIKRNAKITLSGLLANNVTLPKGDHVIIIKIGDTKGRTNEKEIEFTVK